MRKSAPIKVVVHYPKTKEGWDELGKRVATAHANYVIEKIDRLNCPTWQKLELLQAVIDTTKGTYKPKEHQKPGWQPSRQTKTHAQHMLFCSDQRRSDSEAVLSVGLFVLHKFLEFC